MASTTTWIVGSWPVMRMVASSVSVTWVPWESTATTVAESVWDEPSFPKNGAVNEQE